MLVQAQIMDGYSEQILEQKTVFAETFLKVSLMFSAAFVSIIIRSLRRKVISQEVPCTTNKDSFLIAILMCNVGGAFLVAMFARDL